MAGKGNAVIIKLESTGVHEEGKKKGQKTGYYYTTTINPKNRQMKGQGKIEVMKYDPVLGKRVLFKENKKLK